MPSPSKLAVLQREFTRSIVGPAARPRFVAGVRGGGRLSAAGAVEVYRRAYPARMSEALGETYEACWRVLGDEDFLAACAAYAREVPSASHDLGDYGRTFPRFLARRFRLPWLADLGRLCWEFKLLFHAKAEAGRPPEGVTADSRLALISSLKRLSLRHSAYGLWARDRRDETPIREPDWKGAERLLLYKSGSDEVWVRRLSPAEDACLAALQAGKTVGRAARGMTAPQARAFFEFLAGSGLVAAVRRPSSG